MDEIIYDSMLNYFSTLSNLGYINYNYIYKLLSLVAIRDFIYNDFLEYISEEDYREIEKSLYKIFGTSCLIPYPEFCNNINMNKLHLLDDFKVN